MTVKKIHLTEQDHRKLTSLINAMKTRGRLNEHLEILADELSNVVIEPDASPEGIVAMGSTVRYRNTTTGESSEVVIVFPGDADLEHGRVSILAPLGSALIGETAGTVVTCRAPGGSWDLSIESVEAPVGTS